MAELGRITAYLGGLALAVTGFSYQLFREGK
jgi:hypothetical protein